MYAGPSRTSSFSKTTGTSGSKLNPKDQVCFSEAYGTCIDSKCEYSHDKMKIEDFLYKQFNKIKFSRHFNQNILNRPPPKEMLERNTRNNSNSPNRSSYSGRGSSPAQQQGRGFPGRSYAGRGGIQMAGRGGVTFGENKYLGDEKLQINVVPNPTDFKPGISQPPNSEWSGLVPPVLQGAERANPGN
jgi:hypothetical protein